MYFHLGDLETAEENLLECLKFTKKTEMNTYRLEALATLGLLRGTKGSKTGRKIIKKSCAEAKQIPLKWFYCKTLLKSMLYEIKTANFSRAEGEAIKLFNIAKNGGSPDMMGWAAYGMGVVELTKGNFQKAIQHLLEAQKTGEHAGFLSLQYSSKMVLADIYLIYLDIKKSSRYYQAAAKLLDEKTSEIPDDKLKQSFISQLPIKRTLLRGNSKYADINFVYSTWSEDIYEQTLLNTIEIQLGAVAKRHYQIAGIITQLQAYNISPDLKKLAQMFDRHKRTITRDIKRIFG